MDEPKILVAIRKRPLAKKEQSKGQTDIISVKNYQTVIVSEYKQKVDLTKYIQETVFNFDYSFDQNTTNDQIYESAIRPLVDSAFKGAKVTCFAYGQTGSGKTFTMNGNQKMGVYGLYSLGASDIFSYLSDSRYKHLTARLSYFEIYCGKLFDLLNKRTELTLRQDNKSNINIIGLQQTPIDCLDRFQELLMLGSAQRVTSQNSANSQSSRSHAILQVILKEGKKVFGKISFIDLAGNQRGADHTDMKKQTRIDGAQINKSLLSLKECIRGLDQGKGHIPFRGSKLTMVLKDSFVGFCRTIMIGNVSPSSASSQNTLNTLRYADRVKQLRKPTQNLTKQQLKSRQMMLPRQNNNAIKIDINREDDAEDIEAKRKQAQKNFGIKSESPKTNQNIQRQQSNDPYRKNDSIRQQQSFGGPVQASRPLVGGLKANNTQLAPNPSQNNSINQNSRALPVLNKAISGQSNSGKINISNSQTKAGQLSQRNQRLFANNFAQNPQSQTNHLNHQPILQNQNSGTSRSNYSGQINGIKGMVDHRMDIEENSMINNQIMSRTNNYMGNDKSQIQNYSSIQTNQNYQQTGNSQMNQFQSRLQNQQNQQYKQNQQSQKNQQNQQSQQNQQNQQYQPNQSNQQQSFREGPIDSKFNQYKTNSQQPQQRPNQLNLEQFQSQGPIYGKSAQFNQPPQKVIIPQDFDGMVDFITTKNDPELKRIVHKRIHEELFIQQNNLINSHSQTLKSSIQNLRNEAVLINQIKSNRDEVSSREYLSLMQESIDQKMSLLEMLRQKMIQFSYKLERVEQIDEQNQNIGPRNQDEQLLDDLH